MGQRSLIIREGALLAIYGIYTSSILSYAFAHCPDNGPAIKCANFIDPNNVVVVIFSSLWRFFYQDSSEGEVMLYVTIAAIVHLFSLLLWFMMISSSGLVNQERNIAYLIVVPFTIYLISFAEFSFFSDHLIKYYMSFSAFFYCITMVLVYFQSYRLSVEKPRRER